MNSGKGTLLAIALSAAAAFGQGTILWDEAVNGSLAQVYEAATQLGPLQLGTNSIFGTTGVERTGNNWLGHDDFFTIEIQSNMVVTAALLSINKPSVWIWVGDMTYFDQLGFASSASTGELLTQMGLGSIGAGIYGIYTSNHDHRSDLSIADYRLDFVVEAIPEPASLWLLLGSLGWLGIRGQRSARLKT